MQRAESSALLDLQERPSLVRRVSSKHELKENYKQNTRWVPEYAPESVVPPQQDDTINIEGLVRVSLHGAYILQERSSESHGNHTAKKQRIILPRSSESYCQEAANQ